MCRIKRTKIAPTPTPHTKSGTLPCASRLYAKILEIVGDIPVTIDIVSYAKNKDTAANGAASNKLRNIVSFSCFGMRLASSFPTAAFLALNANLSAFSITDRVASAL